MTHLAIVILNWNTREFLEKFLPPLVRYSNLPGVEIIVADSRSTDGSVELMKKTFGDIRLIELDDNYGFAGGYNRALKQVEANYYLLLNSDIEVQEHWLEPLISFMDQHSQVAACSPVLRDYHQRGKLEYAGAAGGYIDRYGYPFCRGRIFGTTEEDTGLLQKPAEVFWTTGACMLIRAALFRKAGGFDEGFFAHMEEVDLCWRLKNMGYRFAVVPGTPVFHVGGGTLPKSNPFKTYLNFRNNLSLLYKNLPETSLRTTIRKRMLLDRLSALMFLARFSLKDFNAVVRAHRDFRKKRDEHRRFREEKTSEITGSMHPEIYNRSVVFDYFIAGRRRFKELRDQFGRRMDERTMG
jgi:GT2 family glycosyltransferase